MKAIELARLLLMYPEAMVLVDTLGNGPKPFRQVDRNNTVLESNEHYFVLTVTEHGSARAKK